MVKRRYQPDPEVGDVWRDADPRSAGREVVLTRRLLSTSAPGFAASVLSPQRGQRAEVELSLRTLRTHWVFVSRRDPTGGAA